MAIEIIWLWILLQIPDDVVEKAFDIEPETVIQFTVGLLVVSLVITLFTIRVLYNALKEKNKKLEEMTEKANQVIIDNTKSNVAIESSHRHLAEIQVALQQTIHNLNQLIIANIKAK